MAPRVLLIDNYDSFTWNLVQALSVLGAEVVVHRNDTIDLSAAEGVGATHLVISPGPGRPKGAGITLAIVEAWLARMPILGVCLGHQAIARCLGGVVGHARELVHGKARRVRHDDTGVFHGLPSPFETGRYHSLAVTTLPRPLQANAWAEDGEIMGFAHPTLPVHGVQFHPESILTPAGPALLANFLALGTAHRTAEQPDGTAETRT